MKSKTILAAGSIAILLLCSMLFAEVPPELDTSKDVQKHEDKEEATFFPIPDYTGDFFSRVALTGDWGGAGPRLRKGFWVYSWEACRHCPFRPYRCVLIALVSEASDTPITDDRGSADQLLAGLGVAYSW